MTSYRIFEDYLKPCRISFFSSEATNRGSILFHYNVVFLWSPFFKIQSFRLIFIQNKFKKLYSYLFE